MSFPSDLEIANSVAPRPIVDVAADLGFGEDEIELYGRTKAKVTLEAVNKTARDHLRPGQYWMVILGPVTKQDLGLTDVDWLE